ncbi:MAG: hypothetical protein CMH51_02350 [Myxococcales bacterium]|jgi:hypothetical protein|nr:hypothetical protein [Myxococcales bacterium]|tara:strand:- start:5199 stop:6083 length:885 start_codon:yes stop_codon:yes gene_type:complete
MRTRLEAPKRTSAGQKILVAVLISIVLVSANPQLVSAQSSLEQVERLTRLGRTEEARAALLEWWENDRIEASRRERQRGLWLRGRLTVDPRQAELDFQRLALLYPSGQFTPDAVLRLAQASWAMGDEDAAREHLATLERDYPRSEAFEQAREWIEDAGPLPPRGDTPTTSDGGAQAPEELGLSAVQESTVVDSEVDESNAVDGVSGSVDAVAMNYKVQLGAFAHHDRAVALYEEVSARGVDVRIVTVDGSQFTHVRAGRFSVRSEAVELLEALAEQGIRAALIRDAREERPAGS